MSFENFFDRMGNIIRSYLDDSDVFKNNNSNSESSKTGDDFYDQAYEEVNDFLNKNKKNNYYDDEANSNQKEDYFSDRTNSANKNRSENYSNSSSYNSDKASSYRRQRTAGNTTQRPRPERPHLKPVPYELVSDFQKLGVPSGSPLEICKTEYKKLLKLHHPDKNAGNPQAIKEATRKTAEINDAYQRIEDWYSKQK